MYAQSLVLVSEHFLSRALIQLTRNTEDHATACFSPYFVFFSLCNPSCAERGLKIHDFHFVAKLLEKGIKICPWINNYD